MASVAGSGVGLPASGGAPNGTSDAANLQGAIKSLLEGQATLQKAVAELARSTAAIAAAQPSSGGTTADGEGEGNELDLDYQDRWPDVEVTVAMQKVSMLDLAEQCVDVDLLVHLDWVDPSLKHGVHYNYNAEHGRFEISKAILQCSNPFKFFNPQVYIENVKSAGDDILQDKAPSPSIVDEVTRDGQELPWLTNTFRFVGTVTCSEIDARLFPFDLERLSVRISGVDLPGITSSGKSRELRLLDPNLRLRWRKTQKPAALRGWARLHPIADDPDAATSHLWRCEDDGKIKRVGEMELLAMGGVSSISERSAYIFHFVLRRQWCPTYLVSFMISVLQVVGAGFSLWVPFTPDMLANRMSITLTVLLTLVAGNAARPPPIESVAYPTLHDHYGQSMLFFVASVVATANLFVFVSCWGMYRGSGPDSGYSGYDFYDEELKLVVNQLSDRWWCEDGPLHTSNLDFIILVLICLFLYILHTVFLVLAQLHRFSVLLRVKHLIDASDRNPTEHSKLVFVGVRGKFELLRREDFVGCIARAALLPWVRVFLRMWSLAHKFDNFSKGLSRHLLQSSQDFSFHPLDAPRLLKEATLLLLRGAEPEASPLSRLTLERGTALRLLDVGSGEMGFYAYSQDPENGNLHAEGVSDTKLKYTKGETFVDQFVTNESGAQALADEIVRRFKLDTKQPQGVARFTGMIAGQAGMLGAAAFASNGKMPSSGNLRAAALTKTLNGRSTEVLPGEVVEDVESDPSRSAPVVADEGSPVLRTSSSSLSAWASSPGLGQRVRSAQPKEKQPIIMCLTGSNRQMLRDDEEGRIQLANLVKGAGELLAKYRVELMSHFPSDTDEAMCELTATEWVVQHGDLNVTSARLEAGYRTLKGGRSDATVTLQDVLTAFSDLHAKNDLSFAFRRAAAASAFANAGAGAAGTAESNPGSRSASGPISPPSGVPSGEAMVNAMSTVAEERASVPEGTGASLPISPSSATLDINAFSDGVSSFSNTAFTKAAPLAMTVSPVAAAALSASVPCSAFYSAFEGSPALMRALLRARMFAGTLSAGSGSSQVTLRRSGNTNEPQVHSIPLGNRTPLVSMKLTSGHFDALFSKDRPRTRTKARELLCGPGPIKETRPAWAEDGSVDPKRLTMWGDLVEACVEECGLPTQQRGLFVGISAVFHAAKEAGCQGQILERDVFLEMLDRRRNELMEGEEHAGRALANITLVMALVRTVLHRTAKVVCKRSWFIGQGDASEEVLATWTLGLYLRHFGDNTERAATGIAATSNLEGLLSPSGASALSA